jgi:hypothetical protein
LLPKGLALAIEKCFGPEQQRLEDYWYFQPLLFFIFQIRSQSQSDLEIVCGVLTPFANWFTIQTSLQKEIK